MELQRFFDDIPILVFLAVTTILMVTVFEITFRVTAKSGDKTNKAQVAQVRAIMGAALGLLAFMLAFSFSRAQSHFEARVDSYLLEISAIDSAYRGADLLDENHQVEAKNLLRQFVQIRRDIAVANKTEELDVVRELVRKGQRIHDELWRVADSTMSSPGDSVDDSIFVNAVLEMIRANDERLQATLYNRISPVIWITLFMMALLAMIVMGHQARLTGTRSVIATWSLAFAFAAVMTLVTDLDRPLMSLFSLDENMLAELHNRIAE